MTNKPVRHESLGWDRALTVCFAVLAAFNFIAATHYSGAKSFALNLIGAIAVLGAIHCGKSLVRAVGMAIRGFGHRLAAMLPTAPVRAIDRLYAEIGQRIARGEEFKFVYNEQSFRRA
jgi:hypothetical protein